MALNRNYSATEITRIQQAQKRAEMKAQKLREALLSQGMGISDNYDPYKFWNEKTGRYDHPRSPHMKAAAASVSRHSAGIAETASEWLERQLYSVRKLAWA